MNYRYPYVIKEYTCDDFSKFFTCSYRAITPDDLEHIAERIAEEYHDQDPGDANDFRATVGVKDSAGLEHWFTITADYSVNFYARKVK